MQRLLPSTSIALQCERSIEILQFPDRISYLPPPESLETDENQSSKHPAPLTTSISPHLCKIFRSVSPMVRFELFSKVQSWLGSYEGYHSHPPKHSTMGFKPRTNRALRLAASGTSQSNTKAKRTQGLASSQNIRHDRRRRDYIDPLAYQDATISWLKAY